MRILIPMLLLLLFCVSSFAKTPPMSVDSETGAHLFDGDEVAHVADSLSIRVNIIAANSITENLWKETGEQRNQLIRNNSNQFTFEYPDTRCHKLNYG